MKKLIIYCSLLFSSYLLYAQANPVWDGSGTGFIVNSNGFIITAAHVVRNAQQIQVNLNGKSWDASVLSIDEKHDIALIVIEATGLKALSLANSNSVQLGEDIRAVGYPLSSIVGSTLKISRGSISGITSIDAQRYLQIDAAVNPGNSGGPILNDKGNVLGIVNSRLSASQTEGIAFAVPINYARAILVQEFVEVINEDSIKENLLGTQIAKIAQESVVYILIKEKKIEQKQITNSISTSELKIFNKENNLRAWIGINDENNPYMTFMNKDLSRSMSLGISNGDSPYFEIKNSNGSSLYFGLSSAEHLGIWMLNKDRKAIARFYSDDTGARIDFANPKTNINQMSIMSILKDESNIFRMFNSKGNTKLEIFNIGELSYYATYDDKGKIKWVSEF